MSTNKTPKSPIVKFLTIILWIAIAIPITLIFLYQTYSILNKQGICIDEMRHISDDELIARWVGSIIQHPAHENSPSTSKDIKNFLDANPNCCHIYSYNPDSGYTPNDDERSFGSGRGYISIEYKIPPKTADSTQLVTQKTTIPVNNCGNQWRSF